MKLQLVFAVIVILLVGCQLRPIGGGTPTAKGWQEVARWTGNGNKTTQVFTITAQEWRVSWTTEGFLGIMVYYSDGQFKANMSGEENQDSSYLQGAGSYYLDITAVEAYTIVVEQNVV